MSLALEPFMHEIIYPGMEAEMEAAIMAMFPGDYTVSCTLSKQGSISTEIRFTSSDDELIWNLTYGHN